MHCKRDKFDVYIGRPSRWGNPFAIGRDGTRADVIAKYRAWITDQPDLLASIRSLHGKRLGCYCSPRPCHGDVLAELAEAAGPPIPFSPSPARMLDQAKSEVKAEYWHKDTPVLDENLLRPDRREEEKRRHKRVLLEARK